MSSSMASKAAREMFRAGKNTPTFGTCLGHLQANIVMIPDEYAECFERFCRSNKAPCPLIYKSSPGEVSAGVFARASDIKTDLPAYRVYRQGEMVEEVNSLSNHPWNDMTTFYLGCSFSFDDQLIASGIKLACEDNDKEFKKNVPMYLTNIECQPAGPFHTNMVLSMRPVKKSLLSTAFNATLNMDFCHGAPIHVGCPKDIGVFDLADSLGDAGVVEEGCVPVFWACGVTSQLAVKNAKLDVSFSHAPGKMFIADMMNSEVPKHVNTPTYPKAIVVCTDEKNERYTACSEHCCDTLTRLAHLVAEDLGNRGIAQLVVPGDFERAVLSLSGATHVGIMAGFPLFPETDDVREENDGIAGALALAQALLTLDKQVTILIDSFSTRLKSFFDDDAVQQGFLTQKVEVCDVSTAENLQFSHLVAIERPSSSQAGGYRTMSNKTFQCDPLDQMFRKAFENGSAVTIGIGDGGNEVGMGKVSDLVALQVNHGREIASTVACHHLITCGVSDWGGYALAAGLGVVQGCKVYSRYACRGVGETIVVKQKTQMLYSSQMNRDLHVAITKAGFRDGKTRANDVTNMTVDGLNYSNVHAPKYEAMRKISESS